MRLAASFTRFVSCALADVRVQAGLSYDSRFNETLIDQGTAYRYFAGFEGAVRDPLQHALAFLPTRPAVARADAPVGARI